MPEDAGPLALGKGCRFPPEIDAASGTQETKMLKKRIFILGAILAMFSLAALAQGPRGGRGFGGPAPDGDGPGGFGAGPRMGGMMGGGMMGGGQMGGGQLMSPLMARLLDLDEAQRTAIRERMRAAAEEAKPLREQRVALRERIEQAIRGNAPEATLDQLAAEGAELNAKSQAISLKTRSYIHNQVLTAEQRAKLDELRQDVTNRRGQGRRGVRGPGANAPAGAPPAGPAGTGPA
jgi:Spy/CpxP family protein refolding chaperone